MQKQTAQRRLHHLEIQAMEDEPNVRVCSGSPEALDAYLQSVKPDGWRVVSIGSQTPSRRKWDARPFPDTQIDPHAPIHAQRPSRGWRLLALALVGAVIGLCYALSRN